MGRTMATFCAVRRGFLARVGSLLGMTAWGAFLSPALQGCESDVLKSSDVAVGLDVAAEPGLSVVGGSAKKTFGSHNGGRPVVIVRVDEGEFLALSSVCTHEGCEVNLPGVRGPEIACDCHGSLFDPESGDVRRGPAQAPLPRFSTSYDEKTNLLTITF